MFLEQGDKVYGRERSELVGERLDDADVDPELARQLESFLGCREQVMRERSAAEQPVDGVKTLAWPPTLQAYGP
jgi:hypothetical protein